jgi:hypothetical protein
MIQCANIAWSVKASQDALLTIICSFYRWRVSVWFFKEFRSPLSWMVSAQCSCTAPKHTSFNSCFGIMLQDQPGNIQNAFLHHTTIYAHYVRRANEWIQNFEIDTWRTIKYTDCKEKSVNKKKEVISDEKPYLMNWSPYFVILFVTTMIQIQLT